jgi:hypothetical protein
MPSDYKAKVASVIPSAGNARNASSSMHPVAAVFSGVANLKIGEFAQTISMAL